MCALSEPLARTRRGSGSGCGATSNWLLRGSKEMEGREGDGFNYATVFCRCHVLFLATVTANITLPHATHKEGTDCEQTQLLICMFMSSSSRSSRSGSSSTKLRTNTSLNINANNRATLLMASHTW